ncbi:MAG: metallophosphoesterase [Alistipes sp.]|nr:metallophosphoesterase [Alistipes sp.]
MNKWRTGGWILLCLLLLGPLEARKPLCFVQLTDPQLGFYSGNRDFQQEEQQILQLLTAIEQLRPDFVVITGDLVHDKREPAQLQGFDRIFRLLDPKIPLYLLPGNHDIGAGKPASEAEVEAYRQRYGADRFVLQTRGCCLIGINTPIIKDGTPQQEEEQFAWIEQQLQKHNRSKVKILLGHQPLFVQTPDEADNYDNFPSAQRAKYLELLRRYRVDLVLSGHLHRCVETRYQQTRMIVTGAAGRPLGKDKPGMEVVTLHRDGTIEARYYDLDHLPSNPSASASKP